MSSALVCPPGFDCAYANSCPSSYVDCPPGYFCSSYEGLPHETKMDYSFAKYETLFNEDDPKVTYSNADQYADPDRAIQTACLKGFYCPDAVTIKPCPAGHWCPERTVEPLKCDGLSICGQMAGYQVNFVNPLIMAILVVLSLMLSFYLNHRQQKSDTESHKKDPSARVAIATKSDALSGNHGEIGAPQSVEAVEKDSGLFEVVFEDVTYAVNGTGRVILPGIRGTVPAGMISALMGPTACGKSTLLNILRSGSPTSGSVAFTIHSTTSGRTHLDAASAQAFIGHVPQDDILDRSLTVRELFTFHAQTRGHGREKSPEEIRAVVDEVLSDLAIQHVADSIIGGGENAAANISGGQLKRVNIGCELVALSKPGLLLLDEPTAGLDAAIAFELMQTLEALKRRGITILMVIQQPRAEIFDRIDHLFLMNMAGGIVYEGPSSQVVSYLHMLGYAPNEEASDADYCLDVLNGICDTENPLDMNERDEHAIQVLDCSTLHLQWKGERADLENPQGTSSKTKAAVGSSSSVLQSVKIDAVNDFFSAKDWSLFFFHSYMNAKRLFLVRIRNMGTLIVYIFVEFIMSVALSSAFSIYISHSYLSVVSPPIDIALRLFYPSALQAHADANSSSSGLTQLLFFISAALGSASALSAVPVFAGKVELARREHKAGISVWSFVLGRTVADTFFVLLNGFVFLGVWCLFGHSGHFYDWMATILATAFAASGIGYIASAAYSHSSASTFAIIASFVTSVFAGVEPTLRQVSRYPVVSWPWYLNYATWTAEATYYTWGKYLTNDGHLPNTVETGAERYGFNVDNGLGRSVGAMMALGVAMRVIAAYMLYRRVTKE